jgi:hypothetical protein
VLSNTCNKQVKADIKNAASLDSQQFYQVPAAYFVAAYLGRYKPVKFLGLFVFCFFASTTLASGFDDCPHDYKYTDTASNERFSLIEKPEHTDWVIVRALVEKSGKIGDAKPIKYSTDLYINRAHQRVRKLQFVQHPRGCWVDIKLYHTVKQ